jgi:integrase
MTPAAVETRNTVKVIARHRSNCPAKDEGIALKYKGDHLITVRLYKECKCPKALLIYEAARKKNRMASACTNSWNVAEDKAQEKRDEWDPEKQELRRLRAEKESKEVRIEEAVALYTADMIARLGDNGTVAMARSLFGHIDPKSKDVLKNGHLFNWLATIPPDTRPVFVADLTAAHLTAWRTSWKFGDYTASQRWGMVCSLFNFAEKQGWIKDSPARRLGNMEYKEGGRTSIFSDKQYAAILAAVKLYDPENVPEATRKAWQQRLLAYVELLRWSGMAPIDAVLYRPELINEQGVLKYRRTKTRKLATVPLPDHVVSLLCSVPLEENSVGPHEPFRMKDFTPKTDRITWGKLLIRLFALAGIKSVRNDVGRVRKPHPYMLRDTFAVWNLRHGVSLFALAKMLGHSNPVITARAYLPWVEELQDATIAEGRKALALGLTNR